MYISEFIACRQFLRRIQWIPVFGDIWNVCTLLLVDKNVYRCQSQYMTTTGLVVNNNVSNIAEGLLSIKDLWNVYALLQMDINDYQCQSQCLTTTESVTNVIAVKQDRFRTLNVLLSCKRYNIL